MGEMVSFSTNGGNADGYLTSSPSPGGRGVIVL